MKAGGQASAACLAAILAIAACGEDGSNSGDTDTCEAGAERCDCRPDSSCDSGLVCASDVCVRGFGGGSGSGGTNQGGSSTGGVSQGGEAGGSQGGDASGRGGQTGGASQGGGTAGSQGGDGSGAGGGGMGGTSGSGAGGTDGTGNESGGGTGGTGGTMAGAAGASGGGGASGAGGAGGDGGAAGMGGEATFTFRPARGTVCSVDGWCFENPRPQGNTLNSVFAVAADDVWSVGDAGTILHWDGATWSGVTAVYDGALAGVWASSSTDVWISGGLGSTPGVLRGDGVTFRLMSTPATTRPFGPVWGASPNDVWVANGTGLHRWNGTGWAAISVGSTQTITGLWGLASNDVYAASTSGVFHYNGSSWTRERSGNTIVGLWGSESAGMWGFSSFGLYHKLGGTWIEHYPESVRSLWGSSGSSIWAVSVRNVHYFDGDAWSNYTTRDYLRAVTGPAAGGGAIAVGDYGSTSTLGPSSAVERPLLLEATTFRDVKATGPRDVWIAGGSGSEVAHFDGSAFTTHLTTPSTTLLSIAPLPTGEVWAGSPTLPFRLQGSSFVSDASAPQASYASLWAASSNAVWAVTGTSAAIHFYNGSSWQALAHSLSSSSVRFNRVWGLGPSDVWVVGTTGVTQHWNGTSWTPHATPGSTDSLVAIWGWGAAHVWAAGTSGSVYAWNGSDWTTAYSALGVAQAMHGCSATDVWLMTTTTTARHFDGNGWRPSRTGTTLAPASVWCASQGDIWAVGAVLSTTPGYYNTILRHP